MKRIYLNLLIAALAIVPSSFAKAQDEGETLNLTYKIGEEEKTASGKTGNLKGLLGDDVKNVTELTVKGKLNVEDIKVLRLMAGSDEYDISKNTTFSQIPDEIKEKLKSKLGSTVFTEESFKNYRDNAFGKLAVLDLSKASFVAIAEDDVEPTDAGGEDSANKTSKNLFLTTCMLNNLIDYNEKEIEKEDKTKERIKVYTYVTVGSGERLPEYMFSNCDNLQKITLNDAETISGYAFRNCDELKECVNLNKTNDKITLIGAGSFAYCKNFDIVSESNPDGALPAKLAEIGNGAFEHCSQGDHPGTSGITKVIIPADVTILNMGAFDNCQALTSLTFDGSLTDVYPTVKELHIMNRAFADCHQMVIQNDGKLPNRIIRIGDYAFSNNSSTKLSLPANEKLTGEPHDIEFNGSPEKYLGSITNGAFGWCHKLQEVHVPANITHIMNSVFQDCHPEFKTITFEDPTKLTYIGAFAFQNDAALKDQFKNLTNVTTVGESAFQSCTNLTNDDANALLSKVTRIEKATYQNCTTLTDININENVNYIDDLAFGSDVNMKTITVNSENITAYNQSYEEELTWENNQITKREWKYMDRNPFSGMNPNQVQLIFKGKADTNYKNYRKDIQSSNTTGEPAEVAKKGNAFMYLLTKTMNEDDTKYKVVAQRHADVKLTRKFKEGWNTLVLPFGAQVADYKGEVKGAQIFKNALNNSGNEDDFMIAVYRGLSYNNTEPDKSAFAFLKYEYEWPLDEFEPILVRMSKDDLNADNIYTFNNVEVNYDGDIDGGKEYTPEGVVARMGMKDENGNYFDGNLDKKENPAFTSCEHTHFYFTGTLTPVIVRNLSEMAPNETLNVGDYIIQNNAFFKCKEGKSYGFKGFRGYFKQKPSITPTAKESLGIQVADEMGNVTAINHIDGEDLDTTTSSTRIYNLNGQLVGTDASALTKGVYIKNGKKFIVK